VLLCWEIYYKSIGKEAIHKFIQIEKKQDPVQPELQSEDTKKQNAFGIKVIAASIGVVGAGIALLGLIASNGLVASYVGLCILLIAFFSWRAAKEKLH